MRIISPFKDYYDFVQAFGLDEKVTYMRNTESAVTQYRRDESLRNLLACPATLGGVGVDNSDQLAVEQLLCGKVPYVTLMWCVGVVDTLYKVAAILTVNRKAGKFEVRNFVDADAAAEYLIAIGAHKNKEEVWASGPALRNCKTKFFHEPVEGVGELTTVGQDAVYDYSINADAPIWAVAPQILLPLLDPVGAKKHGQATLDLPLFDTLSFHFVMSRSLFFIRHPMLQFSGIAAVEDPTQLFQKISMFIGAEASRKEIPPVSPEHVRLEQRGFDRKQSFRHRK